MKFFVFAAGALALVATPGSPAQAQNYPWCALYTMADGPRNCGFVSFEQCMENVRGMGGFCMANNTYHPPAPGRQPRRHPMHS